MKAVFNSIPQSGRAMNPSLNFISGGGQQGGGSGTSREKNASAASGAVSGAATGAQMGGGWGALAGAVIGGGLSYMGASGGGRAEEHAASEAAGQFKKASYDARQYITGQYGAATRLRRPIIEAGETALAQMQEIIERGEELSPAQERALDRALQKSQQFAALGNFGGLGSGALAEIQANIALDPQLQNIARADAMRSQIYGTGMDFRARQARSQEEAGKAYADIVMGAAPGLGQALGTAGSANQAAQASFMGQLPGIAAGAYDIWQQSRRPQQTTQPTGLYGSSTYAGAGPQQYKPVIDYGKPRQSFQVKYPT